MRYSELNLKTQRQAPSHARSEGAGLLRRASFLDRDGGLTLLGARVAARLEELLQSQTAEQLFSRLEIQTFVTESGEAYFPLQAGRVELAHCMVCGYAAPRDLARTSKTEPPAETVLPLEKVPTPASDTIEALARFLGIPKSKTAKAMMYTRIADQKFVFVVLRGDQQLSQRKLKELVGDVRLATTEEILAAGATPGYASPVGLTEALVVVDDLIPRSPNLVAGANEPGFHLLNTNCGRDYAPAMVADLAAAESAAPCPVCKNELVLMNAELLAGTAGYCFESILEALAETHRDEKGLALPALASPFEVYLLHLAGKQLDTRRQAEALYEEWERAGIPVLFDDRDERAGVKFTDADLIGLPIRATVGERGMRDGMVELKLRKLSETRSVPFAEALNLIRSLTKTAS